MIYKFLSRSTFMFSFQKFSRRLRKIKKKNFASWLNLKKVFSFILQLTFGEKISFVWGIIMFISLFLVWWTTQWEELNSFNSFHRLLWGIGYIITLMLFGYIVLFFMHIKNSNFLFYRLGLKGHFYKFWIVLSILCIFLVTQSFITLQGLKVFLQNIDHGNWVPLCITWLIIFFIWNILISRKNKKTDSWKYYTNLGTNKSPYAGFDEKNKEDNMKLPF